MREEALKERRALLQKMGFGAHINLDELRTLLKDHGDYTNEDALNTLFKDMDADGDGDISFEEADEYEDRPSAFETTAASALGAASAAAAAGLEQAAAAASAASAAISEAVDRYNVTSNLEQVAAAVAEGASAAAASAYEVCRVAT